MKRSHDEFLASSNLRVLSASGFHAKPPEVQEAYLVFESLMEKLLSCSRTGPALEVLADFFKQARGSGSVHIFLFDPMSGSYYPACSQPAPLSAWPGGLGADAALVQWLAHWANIAAESTTQSASAERSASEARARQQLQMIGQELAAPLIYQSGLIGVLLLGKKNSTEEYTPQDLAQISQAAHLAGLWLGQTTAAESREIVGTISRGLAHDLQNWLTPISTVLQLCAEGETSCQKAKTLLPRALQSLVILQSCLKRTRAYAARERPFAQAGRLDRLLHQATELLAMTRTDVEVVCDTSGEVIVEMDELLILRLLTNLISNAINASPKGDPVRVELHDLASLVQGKPWVQIKIIDRGPGMDPDLARRLLVPPTAACQPVNSDLECGQGLEICRQIILLHGGRLNIVHEQPRGTTIEVNLPVRHYGSGDAPPVAGHK